MNKSRHKSTSNSFFEKHFSRLLGFIIFLTFDLMLLGAAVRALDAGLTCPDWPMCFGQAVPKFHLGVYLEFIHRCIAGVVFILFAMAYVYTFTNFHLKQIRWVLTVGFLLLLSQVIMGGLTVLKLLAPGIVTLHLGLAAAFLMSLIYAESLIVPSRATELSTKNEKCFRNYKLLSFFGLVLICIQILLGGWVASNYAGGVCADFPTCNGQWFPAWTGPIGAQVIHRLGAYILSLFFTGFFILSLALSKRGVISIADKVTSGKMFMLVLSQIMVGVLNVTMAIPAWLTVIHLGLAIFLMITILKLNISLHKRTFTS